MADLTGADLRETDLTRADLRKVDLRGADLSRADLRGTEGVTEDELRTQAASFKGATMPNGHEYDG